MENHLEASDLTTAVLTLETRVEIRQSVADLWNEACIDEQSVSKAFFLQRCISAPCQTVRAPITAEDEDVYALRCRIINKVMLNRTESQNRVAHKLSPFSHNAEVQVLEMTSFHDNFDPAKSMIGFRGKRFSKSVPSLVSNEVTFSVSSDSN
jgi:hypothetical protein